MTVAQNSWGYHIVPAASGHPHVLIHTVPGHVSCRNLTLIPHGRWTYQAPPAPRVPYRPLPGSSSSPYGLSPPPPTSLFPINLTVPRHTSLLTPHQIQLLSDFIPPHTTVFIQDCSQQTLVEVNPGAVALTTAEFTAFLHYFACAALPSCAVTIADDRNGFVHRSPRRSRMSPPTGVDVLRGRTQLWALHSDAFEVWSATVDVPRSTIVRSPFGSP
ncbi:hypothetical protein C8F01DRAFT_1151568 [Mycena amicta]|nr:hypothetical protein C8F01DRAFT_1151568 [Mycena amicta]